MKGDPGPAGPQGPPGQGLNGDFAFIRKVSWQQAATLSPAAAATLLVQSLKCSLSRSLDPELQQKQQPQVMQVWFEPAPDKNGDPPNQPTTLTVFDGRLDFTPQTLAWTTTHPPDLLTKVLNPGGRILIRIHCGHLFDTNKRPFSASLDAVVPLDVPHLPGGVFESWFFVRT